MMTRHQLDFWCHPWIRFYISLISPQTTLSLTVYCSDKSGQKCAFYVLPKSAVFSRCPKMLFFLILASGASADCGFKGSCPRDGEATFKIVWLVKMQNKVLSIRTSKGEVRALLSISKSVTPFWVRWKLRLQTPLKCLKLTKNWNPQVSLLDVLIL